jgi:Mg-chelatase subunit ChlD
VSKAGATGLFGIDVKSRRICYVIDLSGSMNAKVSDTAKQTRAELAKAELIRAIRALEDDAWFAVVLYSSDVSPWRTEMMRADAASRKAAVEFVEKAPVVGGTATFDALAGALGLGDVGKGKARGPDASGDGRLDTIVLLSDGRPTNGRITEPEKIRAEIRRLNERRGIAIHTIAFGKDADTSFLEKLAKENAGTFVAF